METSVTPNMAQAMQGTEDVPNDPGYVFFFDLFFLKIYKQKHLTTLQKKMNNCELESKLFKKPFSKCISGFIIFCYIF